MGLNHKNSSGEIGISQSSKFPDLGWYGRVVEVIVSKIELFKMTEMEEATIVADRNIDMTTSKVKNSYMANVLIILYGIP